MEKRVFWQEQLTYWTTLHAELQKAYIALASGGVKSYLISNRQLTRYDLGDIANQIDAAEKKIFYYDNLINGGKARKAFGILPRDW